MSIPQSNSADNGKLEGNVSGTNQNVAEEPTLKPATPGSEARANGEGVFDDISGDEFLKEMLKDEDVADFLQGAGSGNDAANGDSSNGPAEDGDAGELEAKLAEVETQLAETREQLLRKAADF